MIWRNPPRTGGSTTFTMSGLALPCNRLVGTPGKGDAVALEQAAEREVGDAEASREAIWIAVEKLRGGHEIALHRLVEGDDRFGRLGRPQAGDRGSGAPGHVGKPPASLLHLGLVLLDEAGEAPTVHGEIDGVLEAV